VSDDHKFHNDCNHFAIIPLTRSRTHPARNNLTDYHRNPPVTMMPPVLTLLQCGSSRFFLQRPLPSSSSVAAGCSLASEAGMEVVAVGHEGLLMSVTIISISSSSSPLHLYHYLYNYHILLSASLYVSKRGAY